MALTSGFKQSMKDRKRKSRRQEVLLSFAFMILGLVEGSSGWNWNMAVPYALVFTRIYRWWDWQRMVKVTSLDDRAVLEHGVVFESLNEAEQKDLLGRYRVGTFVMGYYPDERDAATERESKASAYEVLRWLLPVLTVIYGIGWQVNPDGALRRGWTNGPVVMSWILLLVIALPQLLRMWTEPDEAGELRPI